MSVTEKGSKVSNIDIRPIGHLNEQRVLTEAAKHNERLGDRKSKKETHIDPTRRILNQHLAGDKYENYYRKTMERLFDGDFSDPEKAPTEYLYKDGQKPSRKDVILSYEIEMQYPGDLVYAKMVNGKVQIIEDEKDIILPSDTPDEKGRPCYKEGINYAFFYPKDMEEFNEWKTTTIEFVKDRFGEKNILNAELHMDETIPHIHILGTPIYKDKTPDGTIERLSYKRHIDGPADLAQLHTEYANSLAYLGYSRGKEWSTSVPVNQHTAMQHRRNVSLLQQEHLPEDPVEAEKQYQGMKSKIYELDQECRRLEPFETMVRNYRARLNDKKHEINHIKDILKNVEAQREASRKAQIRQACILRGMELAKDQETVNLVKQLEENFFEKGKADFENQGLILDYDQDGHDDYLDIFVDKDHDGHDDRVEEDVRESK